MIGKPVTNELIAAGFDITLLSRNVQKTKQQFPHSRIVEGDVFDPLSLAKAFEGQDAIYINLSPPRNSTPKSAMPEREGIDNIISVAQEMKIKRLVLISSLVQHYNNTNNFHWWIFDLKQDAVRKIKASGIPYTIFYPSSFMECFDQLLKKGNRLMLSSGSIAPNYFIAGKDYGKQVAQSLRLFTTENKEYVVQGTEPYNWDEAAAIFMKHYTKSKLKPMKAPLGMLKFFGNFSTTMNYGAHILEALNKYPEQFESANTWAELGKPTITLKEYAADL